MNRLLALCALFLLAFITIVVALNGEPRPTRPSEESAALSWVSMEGSCPISAEHQDSRSGSCCAGPAEPASVRNHPRETSCVHAAPAAQEEAAQAHETAKVDEAGDPYPLTTCPVSGEDLGTMGEPVTLSIEGREVRLCCRGCVSKVEAEPDRYLAAADQEIIAHQKPHYPLEVCIITGEPLKDESGEDVAIDVLLNNRLFRVRRPESVLKLRGDVGEYLARLDAAVEEQQAEGYPLKTCLVREKSELGAMGAPVELVIGNRLIRLCCAGCESKLKTRIAHYLTRLDVARQAEQQDRHEKGE